jgi:hypothetical protein
MRKDGRSKRGRGSKMLKMLKMLILLANSLRAVLPEEE